MTEKLHVIIAILSDKLGGIIAWEPFVLCIVGLILALEFEEEIGRNFSISVSFNLMPTCAVLVIAWLTLTAFNAAVWRAVLQRYDPFFTLSEGDQGGPYCSCDRKSCCCVGFFCSKNIEDKQTSDPVTQDAPQATPQGKQQK